MAANIETVAAVIVVGDVRYTANQSYNFGTGAPYDGWFPRTSEMRDNLDNYADIMRNWCVDTDPICAAHLPDFDEESRLNYYDLDSESAASWIKSVASLTADSDFTTAIPTSVSGTVQDYATIGTATPSGSVTLDTTWTSSTSYAACTATSYSQYASNGTSSTTKSTSASGSSTEGTTTKASTPTQAAVTRTSTGTADPTATDNAGAMYNAGGGFIGILWAVLAVMFI